ncbi:VOC family protein [Salmonirosea aquatica]|uniref:Glyoxalase n=1 Tax=Salmonirosea aquatica TaxID=2654236 RepID=A0A7C9FPF2_9BACT|nr:glyoxalase [Cytophagaceae bacterium SJW1-29]
MLSRVALTVKDLSRSLAFYEKTLNFRPMGRYTIDAFTAGRLFGMPEDGMTVEVAVLSLGDETIELMEFQTSATGDEIPANSRSNDRWFQHLALVVSNMDTAYEHLKMFDIEPISPSPQTLPGYLEAAGISAFYFKDPDGHVLELIHFPADQGESRWHRRKAGLFLGIDHTAIVVKETAASWPFYQKLGLKKDSQTKNYGLEQEKLNQVDGARLLITGLRFGEGMGIEFLDFKTPTDGRPFPTTARPNDLIHWHTVVTVEDVGRVFDELMTLGYPLISKSITAVSTLNGEAKHGFLLRDTDGHAVLISEK